MRVAKAHNSPAVAESRMPVIRNLRMQVPRRWLVREIRGDKCWFGFPLSTRKEP